MRKRPLSCLEFIMRNTPESLLNQFTRGIEEEHGAEPHVVNSLFVQVWGARN